MIWTDPFDEWPRDAYIHPLYDGKGTHDRVYRPVWHAVTFNRGRVWGDNDD